MERGEKYIDPLLKEVTIKAPVVNFSEIYGFDYGIFHEAVVYKEQKEQ